MLLNSIFFSFGNSKILQTWMEQTQLNQTIVSTVLKKKSQDFQKVATAPRHHGKQTNGDCKRISNWPQVDSKALWQEWEKLHRISPTTATRSNSSLTTSLWIMQTWNLKVIIRMCHTIQSTEEQVHEKNSSNFFKSSKVQIWTKLKRSVGD